MLCGLLVARKDGWNRMKCSVRMLSIWCFLMLRSAPVLLSDYYKSRHSITIDFARAELCSEIRRIGLDFGRYLLAQGILPHIWILALDRSSEMPAIYPQKGPRCSDPHTSPDFRFVSELCFLFLQNSVLKATRFGTADGLQWGEIKRPNCKKGATLSGTLWEDLKILPLERPNFAIRHHRHLAFHTIIILSILPYLMPYP